MKTKLTKMRKFSRTLIGKIAIFGAAAVLVGANLEPILLAHAEQHGEGEYELSISVDSNTDWLVALKINGVDWNSGDTYLSNDNHYVMAAELHVPNEQERQTTSIRAGGGSGPYEIQQAGQSEDWEGTHRKFTYTINYELPDGVQIGHLSLNPYSEDNGGEPGPGLEPEGDTEATIRIRGGEGSFDDSIYDEDHNIIEERIVNYTDTYHEGSYSINGGWFQQPMPEDQVEGEDYSEINVRYNDDPESDTVVLGFAALWHMRYVDAIVINGENYNIPVDYDDQLSYLEHYGGQVVTFGIEVPKANNNFYDVTVKIGRGEHTWIGNFLWTADPEQQYEKDCHWNEEAGTDVCEIRYDEEGNPIPGRDYIGNSSLELLEVAYTVNDVFYHCSAREENAICEWYPEGDEENAESCSLYEEDCGIPYLEFDSGNEEYDDGSLVLPAGATITVRVIPDYGYQVMNVNMADLEVSDDGIGEFTFTVPSGAAYFVADVIPVEDVVNVATDKVAGGSISLGEDQTTLNHGSARLDINDVDLTNEDIEGFEGAAGDYEIKNFLEISLFNVTCKGAEVCTGSDEDSWNEQIEDLNEPATITLQLEEGVDGNEIVIVHQKHDGTYEVIPTTYNAETNTITFTTSSFSNYAIASRTVEEDDATLSVPDTGLFITTSGGAIASIAGTLSLILGVSTFMLWRRNTRK